MIAEKNCSSCKYEGMSTIDDPCWDCCKSKIFPYWEESNDFSEEGESVRKGPLKTYTGIKDLLSSNRR